MVAPANDNFANAVVVDPRTGTLSDNVPLTEATVETGEPLPSGLSVGATTLSNTIWYVFTPHDDGQLTADLRGGLAGNAAAIYQQTGSGFAGLVQLAAADNVVSSSVSRNQTYYVQIGVDHPEFGINPAVLSIVGPPEPAWPAAFWA